LKTLSNIRRARNITQKVLADAVGVTQRAIANYEAGTRQPSPEVGEKIARFLGMDIPTMWEVLYRSK